MGDARQLEGILCWHDRHAADLEIHWMGCARLTPADVRM
jgi:hypothetical protein